MARLIFMICCLVMPLIIIALAQWLAIFWWALVPCAFLILVGLYDMIQDEHTILRNFPVIGHGRYMLESIRPEIHQYFIEGPLDERPFSREQRALIYSRSKGDIQTVPFGTQRDLYAEGADWIAHSLNPIEHAHELPRVTIGNSQCKKPYSCSLLNISAMSFGSLSNRAVLALNRGAKAGAFAHNTGEGGVSPYHMEGEGDLIWQIGTGYFGCRKENGRFCEESFAKKTKSDQIKMIELKLSQGAKPGHGGILPAQKVTEEISKIRMVPMGKDVLSPPSHREFNTPMGLIKFIEKLRNLSGGKPIGFKLCIGSKHEFFAICKAMQESKIYPDFISVDGAEGGTGAAPLEFSNRVGTPLRGAVNFVHQTLVGLKLRQEIKIIASGKVVTGFDIFRLVALGADTVNSARAMMFALGCIQALRCHSNHCPTGVATQNPSLIAGLNVDNKAERVARYHQETLKSFNELIGAAGLDSPQQIKLEHIIHRRDDLSIGPISDHHITVQAGSFLEQDIPKDWKREWRSAQSSSWQELEAS